MFRRKGAIFLVHIAVLCQRSIVSFQLIRQGYTTNKYQFIRTYDRININRVLREIATNILPVILHTTTINSSVTLIQKFTCKCTQVCDAETDLIHIPINIYYLNHMLLRMLADSVYNHYFQRNYEVVYLSIVTVNHTTHIYILNKSHICDDIPHP